jgi:hypothetical protein
MYSRSVHETWFALRRHSGARASREPGIQAAVRAGAAGVRGNHDIGVAPSANPCGHPLTNDEPPFLILSGRHTSMV